MTVRTTARGVADMFRQLWRRLQPADALELGESLDVMWHDLPETCRGQFVAAGYRSALFFPHRLHWLPKAGPDGAKLAARMCGVRNPAQLWQIVLFAEPPSTNEFPAELFFDRDLQWHEQHFGRPGQVASVDLAADGETLYSMAHQSDLVQRISRRRDMKTRIEKVFKGWHHLLLNGVAAFATARGFRTLRVPTSRLAMENTDRARQVQPELFERVYDRVVAQHFRATEHERWWTIDLAANRDAIIMPETKREVLLPGRTVCILHDIERGLGHEDVDPAFARQADALAPAALDEMLVVERRAAINATYNVVGCLFAEVRDRIERDGHSLAFHSYDHHLGHEQLVACRKVDYRVKGYRPPQSRLTVEMRLPNLLWHNVEWLASSSSSLGFDTPRLEERLVRIPIHLDDFPLHTGAQSFEEWRAGALDLVRTRRFTAIGLHDCYAPHWLPHYETLLSELAALATPRTMNAVAADLYLAGGV